MKTVTFIADEDTLTSEFVRLCKSYRSLKFAVAWCGDPSEGFPYSYLRYLQGPIRAAIGIDFNHSHPRGIKELVKRATEVRIATNPGGIFHPKMYLFERTNCAALLVGSCNFTKTGFSTNEEASILVEGRSKEMTDEITKARARIDYWLSPEASHDVTDKWLRSYTEAYWRTQRNFKKGASQANPVRLENQKIGVTQFLAHATWEDFLEKVQGGIEENAKWCQKWHKELPRKMDSWTYVLNQRKRLLPKRWNVESFNDPELRSYLFGTDKRNRPYGAFGHVGASGRILHLIASGTKRERMVVASCLNQLQLLSFPVQQDRIRVELDKLCKLGPTMNVWGRMLLLLHPESYFTVSDSNVRSNLSKELGISQDSFSRPEGYLLALGKIHGMPWFRSSSPKKKGEVFIWQNRAAFIDAILY